jgi:hypothetical protein
VTEHPTIGPEWQQAAKSVLSVIDPLLQAGAAAFKSAAEGAVPGKCTQAWCPLCGAAALASGEQHPLATMITGHGAALLTLLRAAASQDVPTTSDAGAEVAEVAEDDPPPHQAGRYEPIPVIIHD